MTTNKHFKILKHHGVDSRSGLEAAIDYMESIQADFTLLFIDENGNGKILTNITTEGAVQMMEEASKSYRESTK